MPTLVINNLGGPLTRRDTGDINSGMAKYDSSWGYDPFSEPGKLTWLELPTSILSGELVTTGKVRDESGLVRVYSTDTSNNLYQIRVNDVNDPDVDTPSIISGLFGDNYARGGGMAFYSSTIGTGKIFLGGDNLVQKVNFDGSSPSIIASGLSAAPRPFAEFLGKVYFGAGENIGEIDSTEAVTTITKLSPGLPSGFFARDLDVTPDGNYLQIVASQVDPANSGGLTTGSEAATAANIKSFKFYWNGVDDAITASDSFTGNVLSAGAPFSNKDYTLGYDRSGTGIFVGTEKKVSLPNTWNPQTNAVFSTGNLVGFGAVEFVPDDTASRGAIYYYGKCDEETPNGLFRLLRHNAVTRDDVAAMPMCIKVSDALFGHNYLSFTDNRAMSGKVYFATNEVDDANSSQNTQNVYKFFDTFTGVGSIVAGVYETQTQLFSKKQAIKEVRVYTEPLVDGNDFVVDLIGSGGSVMGNGSQRFAVGSVATSDGSIATGTDMVHFNPGMIPTYALGIRLTNSSTTGVVNWRGLKVEVDHEPAGK